MYRCRPLYLFQCLLFLSLRHGYVNYLLWLVWQAYIESSPWHLILTQDACVLRVDYVLVIYWGHQLIWHDCGLGRKAQLLTQYVWVTVEWHSSSGTLWVKDVAHRLRTVTDNCCGCSWVKFIINSRARILRLEIQLRHHVKFCLSHRLIILLLLVLLVHWLRFAVWLCLIPSSFILILIICIRYLKRNDFTDFSSLLQR